MLLLASFRASISYLCLFAIHFLEISVHCYCSVSDVSIDIHDDFSGDSQPGSLALWPSPIISHESILVIGCTDGKGILKCI